MTESAAPASTGVRIYNRCLVAIVWRSLFAFAVVVRHTPSFPGQGDLWKSTVLPNGNAGAVQSASVIVRLSRKSHGLRNLACAGSLGLDWAMASQNEDLAYRTCSECGRDGDPPAAFEADGHLQVGSVCAKHSVQSIVSPFED